MALTIQNTKPKQVGFFAGVVTAIFAIALQPIMASGLVGAIVINEVMPNPVTISDSDGEWVEIHNPGSGAQDVSDWTLGDGENSYTFPSTYSLAAGQYYVICNDIAATDATCDAEWTNMALANGGEVLTLKDSSGSTIDVYEYVASQASTATEGQSLEIVREDNIQTTLMNSSDNYGPNGNAGTPGAANTAQANSAVVNQDTGENFSTLQAAIDDADTDNGDTLHLKQYLTTTAQITVDKEITIDGRGYGVDADFAKTDNSNNSAIGVQADNVTLKDIQVTSTGDLPYPQQLHGVNVYDSVNVLLDGISAYGFFGSGILYNSSTGTIRNVTTYSNAWNGINVDTKTSQAAAVTIEGVSTHNEPLADIYVDDDRISTLKAPAYSWERSGRPNTDRDYTQDRVYRLSDPTDSHQLTLSGTLYRDRALDDCDNRSECLAQPADNTLQGWEVRLYKENESGDWVYVKSATSNQDGVYNLGSQKQPGTYHVCEVVPTGWSQAKQTWSGSGYKVDTPNQSGATEEGPYCTTTNYDDTRDRSSKSRIGNVDTKKPFTQILSPLPDGQAYSTDFSVIAKTTDGESGVVQAVMNLYDENGFKASCTNDAISPAASMHEYRCDVDVDGLTEGDYYLKVNSKDAQGNTSNTISWTFSVDTTAPSAPTITEPGARQWFKSAPIVNKWTSVTDTSGIDYYQIAYNYDDGHSFGGSTCPGVNMVGYVGFIGCRDVTSTQRSHQPGKSEEGGVTIWVRAVDNAGNVGPWSKPVNYHYDHTAPTTTIVAPVGITDGTFTVSGVAGDNLQLNRVYVQLVNRDDNKRYGGTTVHLISEGTSSDWSRNYSTVADNLPDGTYAAHVSVVDMAGNSSTAGWTDNFVVDGTKPSAKVVTPANGSLNGADFTVSGTANDNETSIDRVEYTVTEIDTLDGRYVATVTSGTATGTDSWTFDLSGLASGFYRLKVQAFDAAGNWKYHYNDVEVDADAPTQVLGMSIAQNGTIVGCGGFVNERRITVGWDASSDANFKHYQYQADREAAAPYEFTTTVGTNSRSGDIRDEDGSYNYRVRAMDAVGNYGEWSDWCSVTLDRTAPVVVINEPAKDDIFNNGAVTVGGTIDDTTVATVVVTLNGTTQDADVQPDGSWETTFAAVPVGTYAIEAAATDAAGNSRTETVDNVTVNPTPPAVTPLPTITPNAGDDGGSTEVLGAVTSIAATLQGQPLSVVGSSQLQNSNDGVQTATDATDDTSGVEVASVADERVPSVIGPTVDDAIDELEEDECFGFFGLCWYWWVAIGVGAGIVVYAIIATKRAGEE